ncbi:hypothetical protein, partial [Acinetobacter sp. 226-1]|uniref:hypothetical protein n=1 Tax=Acinetobacter sp. 226-1 TaxID=2746718 RepID=UPI00257516B8
MTALLLGSGLTQAATTTSSIPMGVDVPRSCTLSNVSAGVIVPEDGTEATGGFTIICNIDTYTFYVTTDSLEAGNMHLKDGNGHQLPFKINQSYLYNSVSYGNYDLDSSTRNWYANGILPIGAPVNAVLKFKLQAPTTATTPAGVYTDTFRVNVTY